jgi:phosphatidate cytidylyltransferase
MSNLAIRALTGILFVAVILGSVFGGPIVFIPLFGIITLGSLLEFYSLVFGKGNYVRKFLGVLMGGIIYLVPSLYFYGALTSLLPLAWLIPLVFACFIAELYLKSPQPFQLLGLLFTGCIYIAVPFTLLVGSGFNRYGEFEPVLLVCIFSFIWINDTGAYVTGRSFGKHPLFLRISPKKTIEGMAGGLALVVIAAFVMAKLQDVLTLEQCLVSGMILSIFSVLGDLVESMLKRSLNVKDSGKLLPGHGGLLDRFDALIGAVPFVYFYLHYLG